MDLQNIPDALKPIFNGIAELAKRLDLDPYATPITEILKKAGEKVHEADEAPNQAEPCEWRLGNERGHKTSCGRSMEYSFSFNFCPGCGRPLKTITEITADDLWGPD